MTEKTEKEKKMKKLILSLVLLAFMASPALALIDDQNVVGAKIDAPQIIKLSNNWSVGAEVGKDILDNVFHDETDYFEDDQGWFGYLKFTYNGTWINLAK